MLFTLSSLYDVTFLHIYIYIYIWNWQNVLININTRTRCASTDTVNTKLQILHNLKTSHYTKLHHLLPPNINMKDFNFVAYGVYALTQFCCLCSACFESIFLSSQGCMAQISYKLCIYICNLFISYDVRSS